MALSSGRYGAFLRLGARKLTHRGRHNETTRLAERQRQNPDKAAPLSHQQGVFESSLGETGRRLGFREAELRVNNILPKTRAAAAEAEAGAATTETSQLPNQAASLKCKASLL